MYHSILIGLLLVTPAIAHASLLTPIPYEGWRYNAGFEQGFLGIPLKGHHTGNFTIGYINGSSTFKGNHDDYPRHDVEWYIGFHNGAMNADNGYQADSMQYNGCPSGHDKDYCSGYEKGWDADADVLAP